MRCLDQNNEIVAQGLSNYGISEVEAIKGLASGAYRQAIGYAAEEEVVHRDNLVLI